MKRATLLPFQVAGVRFLTERRFAILADDPGLGKTTQVLRAISEVGAEALIIATSVVGKNAWEAEIAVTPGARLDRSKTGIFPSPGSIRVMTVTELLRRKLSPRAAPRSGSVLVVDNGCFLMTGQSDSAATIRLRTKLSRLADAFARNDGAIWIVAMPDPSPFCALLEATGFMLRRRVAGPLCDHKGCEATATILTMDSRGPKPHRRCVRRRCARHRYEPGSASRGVA